MFGGNKFKILGVDDDLAEKCKTIGWNEPTEIQRKVIPLMLKGNDVIALAETGSGKTGAFAIPIIEKLFVKSRYNFALILTPTHELALQIKNEFLKLGESDGLKVITLVGGEFIADQEKLLKANNYHIIIGTPGRIVHHIVESKLLKFKNLKFLVLDEADRMLGDDFVVDLGKIVSALPGSRQTCLFSATMTNKLEKLETVCLKKASRVEVSRKHQTVEKLRQEFAFLHDDEERLLFLVWKLQNMCSNSDDNELLSAIVFTETKKDAKILFGVMKQLDISVVMLHSDLDRDGRQNALDKFASGKVSVLVATDVASRGLDIPSVGLVINYNVPDSSKDYQHRVGRTARAGRSGLAISLVTPYTVVNLLQIEKDIKVQMTKINLPRDQIVELKEEVAQIYNEVKKNIKDEQDMEREKKKRDKKPKNNLKRKASEMD